MRGLVVGAMATAALLCSEMSLAQVTTAAVHGQVRDESGTGVPATVTARNTATGARRVVAAGASGAYWIGALPVGPYEMTAAHAGFSTEVRTGMKLRVGQQASLDFTLRLAAVEETVTVHGEAPMVEPTRTALGRTFTTKQIDDLAVSGRSFTNLAFLAPGILDATGPTSDTTTVVISASGGGGANNTFVADGLSLDQATSKDVRGQIALDAIAELEVLSGQFSAEFGQASGAVLNLVTRSGANDLHGRAYAYYRADGLAANDPFVQPDKVTGRKEKAPFSQTVIGGHLGGALKKDATFFFLSYDHTFRDDTTVVSVNKDLLASLGQSTETSFRRPLRNPLVLAKIDQHLTSAQTLTARYRLDRASEKNANFGGKVTREAGLDTLITNQDVALSHTWTLSARVLNDIRLQFARRARRNDADDYCPRCPLILRPSVTTGKSSNQPQSGTEDRFQIVDSLSFRVPGRAGDHVFKAGLDLGVLAIRGVVPQNFDGLFFFSTDKPFDAADPATYPQVYQVSEGDPSFRVRNNAYAAFLQDQWKVTPHLTLNLGLRWDYEDHIAVEKDTDNLAPRLHFAWDPLKDGKTSVRGGFGTYYDQVFLNVPLLSVLLSGRIRTTTLVSPGYPNPRIGARGIPVPNPPPTIATFQQGGLDTPHRNVFSLGFERELARDLAVTLDLISARGHHLLQLIDENYSAGGAPRPNPRFSQILTVESRGMSKYKALQVGLDRRFVGRYGFGVAYTLADTKRDTEGHQFVPVDSRHPEAEIAAGNSDARHTLAGSVNAEGPWGVKLGLVGRYRSALPYNVVTGRDDNRDLVVNDRPTGFPRNSARGSPAWTIDLRLAKAVGIGKAKVEAIVEGFNLLNHPSVGFYEGNRLSPRFGLPTQTMNNFRPRQVQLGLRLDL